MTHLQVSFRGEVFKLRKINGKPTTVIARPFTIDRVLTRTKKPIPIDCNYELKINMQVFSPRHRLLYAEVCPCDRIGNH